MPLDTRAAFYDGTPVKTPAELTPRCSSDRCRGRTFTENLMA
jgi:hypothetical protein